MNHVLFAWVVPKVKKVEALATHLHCLCWTVSSFFNPSPVTNKLFSPLLTRGRERERRRGAHHILHAGFSQCISDIHLWNSSKYLSRSFLSHPPIFQACCESSNAQSLSFTKSWSVSQCISDIHLCNCSKLLWLSFLSHPPILRACGSSNTQSLLVTKSWSIDCSVLSNDKNK